MTPTEARLHLALRRHTAYHIEGIATQIRRMSITEEAIGTEDGGLALLLGMAIRLDDLSGVLMQLNGDGLAGQGCAFDQMSKTVFGVRVADLPPELLN